MHRLANPNRHSAKSERRSLQREQISVPPGTSGRDMLQMNTEVKTW